MVYNPKTEDSLSCLVNYLAKINPLLLDVVMFFLCPQISSLHELLYIQNPCTPNPIQKSYQ